VVKPNTEEVQNLEEFITDYQDTFATKSEVYGGGEQSVTIVSTPEAPVRNGDPLAGSLWSSRLR
jgi:hypothetical protein